MPIKGKRGRAIGYGILEAGMLTVQSCCGRRRVDLVSWRWCWDSLESLVFSSEPSFFLDCPTKTELLPKIRS